jgi:hypothetical protein
MRKMCNDLLVSDATPPLSPSVPPQTVSIYLPLPPFLSWLVSSFVLRSLLSCQRNPSSFGFKIFFPVFGPKFFLVRWAGCIHFFVLQKRPGLFDFSEILLFILFTLFPYKHEKMLRRQNSATISHPCSPASPLESLVLTTRCLWWLNQSV